MLEQTAPTTVDTERDAIPALQVRAAQVEQIYSQYKNALIGQLLAGIVAAIFMRPVVAPSTIIIWFGVCGLVQVARYLHSRKYHAAPRPMTAQAITRWAREHVWFVALTALVWSAGLQVMWPGDSGFHQVGFVFIAVVTVAAALVGHTLNKASYAVYMVVTLVPIATRFLFEGTSEHTTLGLATFLAIAMLLRIANRSHKASYDALIIGLKYRQQATTLADQMHKTAQLNAQLVEQTTAVRASEARFRELSRLTFEGIAIHEGGRIVDANLAALNMFGYEQSEIDGLTIHDLILPEFYELAALHIRTGYEEPYEVIGVRKDGSEFPAEVQAKTVSYNNAEVRVVAVRDITARKQLEQATLALRLEQAQTDVLRTFVQNASHEFRTPLTIIQNATYFIERAATADQQSAKLETINQQVSRITRLVDDLLLMVKLDSATALNLQAVNLNNLLEATSQSLQRSLEQKQHRLRFDPDPDLPAIRADGEILNQAFYAILQNAAQYTPEAGSITIQTRHNCDYAIIEVHDNGIGMTEAALDRIFDRFYRVDDSHSSAGFGVGLSIAKVIIDLHQGMIVADSQPGHGSSFTIRLPITRE